MSPAPGQAFWEFSLMLYSRPGVAEACLRLQDRLGADVNLLLFGCWVGACGGGRLADADWRRLIGGTGSWRSGIVEPLRQVRRRLKTAQWPGIGTASAMALRVEAQRLELEAEHIEQRAIAALFPVAPDASVPAAMRTADAAANIAGYVTALAVRPAACDRADMDLVVASAPGARDKM